MDPNQTTAQPPVYPPLATAGVFGSKIPTAVAFAVGILNFTPWLYVAVIAFLAAAVFSYMRIRSVKT